MLERELQRLGVKSPPIAELLGELALDSAESLHEALGLGEVSAAQVAGAIQRLLHAREARPEYSRARTAGARAPDLEVQGIGDLLSTYARCCKPVPPEPIVGYITVGRGVSIHRADCPNLLFLAHEPERRLDIDWQEAQGERFVVRLALEGNDRRGLYADVAAAVSDAGTNIRSMDLRSTDGKASGAVLVEVENLAHLTKIMRAARKVKGITDVQRRERINPEA